MERRAAGVLVLLAALVAAVVSARLMAGPVAGSAVAILIPEPPKRGDCVLETPASLVFGDDQLVPQVLATGPCEGARFGEIIRIRDAARVSSSEARLFFCEGSASMPDFDPERSLNPDTPWRSLTSWTWVTIRPTALQEAAGQSWRACAMTVPPGHVEPYPGELPAVVRDPHIPQSIPMCGDNAEGSGLSFAACTGPHVVELLAVLPDLEPAAGGDLAKTCAEVASSLLRVPDPTINGLLAIEVTPTAQGRSCWLAPSDRERRLTGSVLGLGDAPVPLN